MSKLTLRVFVSSPGDVGDERRMACRVLERLGGRYATVLEISPYLWEHEPVRATSTFQDQLLSPAQCDTVICILWSRLGTRLPDGFARDDGTVFESGTAFEFEVASAAYEKHGRPDLLVYRKTAEPLVDIRDRDAVAARSKEWGRLDDYLAKWFRNPDGSLKAGFVEFERLDQFEELLEKHLEVIVRDHLDRAQPRADVGESDSAPTWLGESPFRGLEIFGFEHAAIFDGRTRAIAEIKDRLVQRSATGCAFLMVYGMSGSGKSSLVQAGVLPSITEPGVVEGVGLWRYAILRPSNGASPLGALVSALFTSTALPELEQGDLTRDELAELLIKSPKHALASVRGALERAALDVQRQESLVAPPSSRLAVVVDQFEELFTDERLSDQPRGAFVETLAALARSGYVWVIGTIRSDFYHRCAEIPQLVELKEGLGSYALLPPGPAQIGQIIRNPARAAGLRFERDDDEGPLDEVLQRAASDDPGSLPLLEFVLDALYETRGPDGLLTFSAYRELGRLEGAIAKRADEVVAELPADVRAELPSMLRKLVTVSADTGTATALHVARDEVARNAPEVALVDAFTEARLLVSDEEGGQPTLRVAHEALLRRWPRARQIIEENRDFLLARSRVVADATLWEDERRRSDLLLPAGKRLAEAEEILTARETDLGERERDYIRASLAADAGRRRRRTAQLAAIFAVLVALLAAAGWQWREANQQRVAAERQAALSMSRKLASDARDALGRDELELALVLSVEAHRRAETKEALDSLQSALEREPHLERVYHGRVPDHVGVAFSPDGAKLAALERQGDRATIWDVESGTLAAEVSTGEARGGTWRLAWGGNGDALALAAVEGEVRLVTLGDPPAVEVLPERCEHIGGVGLSPDGRHLTIACFEELWRWSRDQREWRPLRLPNLEDGQWPTTVSRDGRFFVSQRSGRYTVLSGEGAPTARLQIGEGDQDLGNWWNYAVAPDGRRLALAATGGSGVSIVSEHLSVEFDPWDARRATDLAFAPDGSRLATVHGDGKVRLWSVASTRVIARPLGEGPGRLAALALSGDRGRVAIGTDKGLVEIRDTSDGKRIGEPMSGWPGGIAHVAFPQSSAGVARGVVHLVGDSGLVTVLLGGRPGQLDATTDGGPDTLGEIASSVLTGQSEFGSSQVRELGDVSGTPVVRTLSPDGQRLAIGTAQGEVVIWDLTPQASFRVHRIEAELQQKVVDLSFTRSGSHLAVATGAGYGMTLTVLPAEHEPEPHTNREETVFHKTGRGVDVRAVALSADGEALAAGLYRGIALWDRAGGEWQRRQLDDGLSDSLSVVRALAFGPQGELLAGVGDDGEVALWDLDAGRFELLAGSVAAGSRILFSPDGQTLVAYSANALSMWNVASRRPIRPPWKNRFPGGVSVLALSRDGTRLAAVADEELIWWTVADERVAPDGTLPLEARVRDLAFLDAGGSRLALLQDRGQVDVFTLGPEGERPDMRRRAAQTAATALSATQGGGALISAAKDAIAVHEDASETRISIVGAGASPEHVALDEDGDDVLFIAGDKVYSGRRLGPDGGARALQIGWPVPIRALGVLFDDQGRALAIGQPRDGGGDAPIVSVELPTGGWVERACRVANRNLTPDEWGTYLSDEPYQAQSCPDVGPAVQLE